MKIPIIKLKVIVYIVAALILIASHFVGEWQPTFTYAGGLLVGFVVFHHDKI